MHESEVDFKIQQSLGRPLMTKLGRQEQSGPLPANSPLPGCDPRTWKLENCKYIRKKIGKERPLPQV